MMLFLWNLILAIFWAAVSDDFTLFTLFVGFIAGFLVLFVTRQAAGNVEYTHKVSSLIRFILYFLYELMKSALRIVHDTLTPHQYMRPGVIAIPLDASTDIEITLLSNLISLTPGTLLLDVSKDRKKIYIHAMYINNYDVEAFRQELKKGIERRLLKVMR